MSSDTTEVVFEDGTKESFDAVIAATGYRPALSEFLAGADAICDPKTGLPPKSGEAVLPGLYFGGFFISPRGMLNQIRLHALHIARAIARRRKLLHAASI